MSIIIEHESNVKYSYCMRKEGFFDLLKLLKSQIQVGVKVKDSTSGVHAVHEILIQNTQIDEKSHNSSNQGRLLHEGSGDRRPLPSAHGGKRGQDLPFLVMLLGQCRINIFFMCYQQMPK